MEDSEQDKSEQPTPFKLTRGREKGTVARGNDLGFLTGLAAFLGFVWIAGPGAAGELTHAVRGALISGPSLAGGPSAVFAVVVLLFGSVLRPLAFMAGTIFLVVLLFEIVQTGPVFSAQPLKPDFTRLNPAKGLKRVFSVRLLVETGKNILKLCVYTTVGFLLIRSAVRTDIGALTDGRAVLAAMAGLGFRLLASFTVIALGFAVLDQLIVRRDFLKKMRMSRREVRREAREREGEPRLKQKRKQLHAEFVKASQSLRNMKGADVLIVNPQHIALALRYDRRTMQAPMVVSIGTNQFAQRLKRLAFIYGIPVVQNRILARELFAKSLLNKQIPEHCFRPVADIYNAMRQKTGEVGATNGSVA
jgi:flagellar biosynthetic protein FlhB